MDLSRLIARHAAFAPAKVALRFEGEALAYGALEARIAATAAGLRGIGIGAGDRLAVLSLNRPDYLVLLYAAARTGAMVVPLNWRLAVDEQIFALRDAEVSALFVEQAFAEIVPPLRAAVPQAGVVGLDFTAEGIAAFETLLADAGAPAHDGNVGLGHPLLIVYTSGTTGRPKGAVLDQTALFANGLMSQHMHDLTADDHVLAVLPFFHVGGLNIQVTAALQHGASVSIHARFEPAATLAAIAGERPSLTVLVPATMQALSAQAAWADTDLSSLRAVTTGSSAVPQHLIDRFNARGVPVLQVYGATETSPIAIYTRLGGDLARPGSTGLPGLLCEARLALPDGGEPPTGEPGEILVRGPNVLREYWRNPQATREALAGGWFRTGDIASRDADGHFHVFDRKKNMIISGGENIYPAEIERVLLAHPDVADAGVIGQADPKWQEVPIAYVVARASCADTENLRAELTSRLAVALARFKQPRDIRFVTDLPRTALGKVQHFKLKQGSGA